MKKSTVVFLVLVGLMAACKKEKQAGAMPACIISSIQQLNNDSVQVDSVKQCTLNGRNVYVLSVAQCCDLSLPVLDQNCNHICDLGGFAASYDCEGRKFDSAAVFVETVWRK